MIYKCYSHMRINCELIITADVKTHFVCKTGYSSVEHVVNNDPYCGILSQGAQIYGRIALKGSHCCKFLMIPEGYAVNTEKYKGGKRTQMLRLCSRNMHIASSRNVANICTDAD